MQSKLDVYIEKGCWNCQQAETIATWVKDEMPHIAVRVIDLKEPNNKKPESVFAVPTYVLNGVRISLGNPDRETLLKTIRET
jgi:hypothetical protein